MMRRDLEDRGMMHRRAFLRRVGAVGCGVAAHAMAPFGAVGAQGPTTDKLPARVRCAFLYPPSEKLRGGWWSWPGNDFDAEGRQAKYSAALRDMEGRLGVRIGIDAAPLSEQASVGKFINDVKAANLDGLLLIPLKHSHFALVDQIIRATDVPTVVFTCLGVKHGPVSKYLAPGCHIIVSLDNLDALESAVRMIAAWRWMQQSRIVSIAGNAARPDVSVAHLGTTIRRIPLSRFVEEVDRTQITDDVRALARRFRKGARRVCEPARPEILTAARVHFALSRLIEAEQGDAVTMDCLRRGKYQPCMSFM
ncbi:MAG: hypothetical protein PVH68_20455, partial [Armatimonadota bacterium]